MGYTTEALSVAEGQPHHSPSSSSVLFAIWLASLLLVLLLLFVGIVLNTSSDVNSPGTNQFEG